MNEEQIKSLIALYLEEELGPEEERFVRDLLKKDARWRQYAEEIQAAWDVLEEVPEIKPGPNVVSRFWTRLAEEEHEKEGFWTKFKETFWSRALAPAFVGTCIVLIAGYFAVRNFSQMNQPEMVVATLEEEEVEMLENLELVENLDLLEDLEFLEDYEVIENLDTYDTSKLDKKIFG